MRMRFWSTIAQQCQPSITWIALPFLVRHALLLGAVQGQHVLFAHYILLCNASHLGKALRSSSPLANSSHAQRRASTMSAGSYVLQRRPSTYCEPWNVRPYGAAGGVSASKA